MLSAIKIWPKTVLHLMSFQDKLNAPDFTPYNYPCSFVSATMRRIQKADRTS